MLLHMRASMAASKVQHNQRVGGVHVMTKVEALKKMGRSQIPGELMHTGQSTPGVSSSPQC